MHDLLLLDTCSLIWTVQGAPMRQHAIEAIAVASERGELFVSPISAWEMTMSILKGRLKVNMPAGAFVDKVFSNNKLQIAPLEPEIAINSCLLPGNLHQDPADRFIAATAIRYGLRLVTRDERLIEYAASGYLAVLTC